MPLLLKHLDRPQGSRSSLIGTLAQIGDQSVADALVRHYPKLSTSEKASVVSALFQLKSPEFMRLAGDALLSRDHSLISAAKKGLESDGGPAAVGLLAKALEQTDHSTTLSNVCGALSAVGTPDARAALITARASTNTKKRSSAYSALRDLYRRSPGYHLASQGQASSDQKQWQTAVEQFSLAIKTDALLPLAYSGRGSAQLHLENVDKARRDFEQSVRLDPFTSTAVTGLALTMVLEGEYQQGVDYLEDARKRFANDVSAVDVTLFAYNAACVYGRAIEHLRQDDSVTRRGEKIQDYQQKALADLKLAVKKGFNDFKWMKEDPDLGTLRDLPEFKKISTPQSDEKQSTG